MDIEIKFSFATDFNGVKQSIDQSINSVPGLLKDPSHRIGISSIEADGYKVLISVWTPAHGFIDMQLLLQQKIIEDLKSAAIDLPVK